MMNFWQLLCFFICISFPMHASAQKARTIDELADMFDSSRCAECHNEIYTQWEKSQHAKPLRGIRGIPNMFFTAMAGATPFSVTEPKQAKIKNYAPCFKCHLPQAIDHAEDSVAVELTQAVLESGAQALKALNTDSVAVELTQAPWAWDNEKLGKLKITCIVCHNQKAVIHKLEEGKPDPGTLYGNNDIDSHDDPVFGKIKKSAVMKHSLMCGQCHGLGPNLEFDNPVQCPTLYGSYLHAYIPAGGFQTCQECHMKPTGDGLADHQMPPTWDNIPQTEMRLRKAISLDVQTLGYVWLEDRKKPVPKVVVNTRIVSAAGHRIPDG